MKVQIIDIGNSKGIRIPQALLKQGRFADEAELEVADGALILKRLADPQAVPSFEALAGLDDRTIQAVLRKLTGADLLTALVGASEEVKAAVARNLSDRVRGYLIPTVERLERGDARDLIIERSRNAVSEAMVEITRG
jgi:antitoxin component of MazEF toxin-antitoxin module